MKSYVDAILAYVPIAVGAAAGGCMLIFGVGQELSDVLNIESDLPRMGIDTLVGIAPIFAAGGIVEGTRALCECKPKKEFPCNYQQE
ncbi:hypothetical protein JW898_01525 [Candidatus Woesearchaeota archaeon]|nr:hypothetical protein [Candidatus Woesearchaeota archaeon]